MDSAETTPARTHDTDLRRGPARVTERALAPDFARGLMLLLIVLSNTTFFLWAAQHEGFGQHPVGQSLADHVVQVAMILLLDMRIYPLFAFLFGYGMMQVFARQTAAGTSKHRAVSLLRRRSLWLLLLGFFHAALLLPTDVLGAYGVISLLLGWLFLRRFDRTMLVWSAIGATLLLVLFASSAWLTTAIAGGVISPSDAGEAASANTMAELAGSAQSNYLIAMIERLANWTFVSAMTVFGVTAPVAMLLGLWAARRRILEQPQHHLRLLRRTAVVGVPIGVLGALPAALSQLKILDLSAVPGLNEAGLLGMQWSSGLAGGLGYVACLTLIARWITRRWNAGPPLPVAAVSAVGKRSLSCYLFHSMVIAPVLAAWGLGLGAYLGSATMALFAIGVWLISVVGAYALERAGTRGPAEIVLRRLMYGAARSEAARNTE